GRRCPGKAGDGQRPLPTRTRALPRLTPALLGARPGLPAQRDSPLSNQPGQRHAGNLSH
ncbi:Hypothetical predicted protein, partial [Marmota monax]